MFVQLRERPAPSLGRLERDLDRIFRGAFGFDPQRATPNGCHVAADANGVTIRAEVPGIDPAQVAVSVDGRTLSIRAERNEPSRGEGTYQLREHRSGAVAHTLQLSDELDADAVAAECVNGVLTVRIPKRPVAQPRQIEVKAS